MATQNTLERLSAFNNLFKRYDNLYRRAAGSLALSDSSLWILYCIRMENRPCSQSEICDVLLQSRQTINSAIKKMESSGLVELAHTGENRKSKRVTLTPAGVALAEKTAGKVIRAETAALRSLPEDEQELLLCLFGKFVDHLQFELGKLKGEAAHGQNV